MQKSLEIVYSRSLKLNKGSYQQDAPMWSEKLVLQLNGETDEQIKEIENAEYQRIKDRIDLRADAEWSKNALDASGLRVREKDGKKFISVTSIMNPEPYTGNKEYGTRGTEVHRLTDLFIDTGKWEEPTAKLETLSYDDLKYKEFFDQFGSRIKPIKGNYKNLEVYHDGLLYSGEIDRLLTIDGIHSLTDYKTGQWKWMQLVAYYKALPKAIKDKIKQLAVFDFKKCVLETLAVNDEKAVTEWEEFLIRRGVIRARFGI